jgi:hypothetical protein
VSDEKTVAGKTEIALLERRSSVRLVSDEKTPSGKVVKRLLQER